MADYKGIKGFTIQNLSADPPAPIVGQVWYNSTTNDLKGYTSSSGAWSSGTAIPAATNAMAGAGTTTATLYWGGAPYDNVGSLTWEYDGSTWTAGGGMTSILAGNAGLGTQTAALGAGGYNGSGYQTDTAMEYNGTGWTAVTADPGSGASYRATAGIQTAGLTVGGYDGSPPDSNITSLYNGSTWTEGGNYPIGKRGLLCAGTQTAAIGAGGPSTTLSAFTYDGSTWTETGSMNNGSRTYGSGGGIQTQAIFYGGSPASVKTESFNGSTWTEVGDLAVARSGTAVGWAANTSNDGVFAIGGGPPGITTVEEWADPVLATVTFTDS